MVVMPGRANRSARRDDRLRASPESITTIGSMDSGPAPRGASRNDSAAIAVLGVLADVLDRHHMPVLGGIEHDDALGRAAGDPDALDRTADQLTLVGHQHDLIRVLDRE